MIQHAGKRCDTTQAANGFLLGSEKFPFCCGAGRDCANQGEIRFWKPKSEPFAKKGPPQKGSFCSSHSGMFGCPEIWDGISGRKKEKDGKENKKAQTRTTPAPREQRQGDPYCWILSTPVYQRNLKDT